MVKKGEQHERQDNKQDGEMLYVPQRTTRTIKALPLSPAKHAASYDYECYRTCSATYLLFRKEQAPKKVSAATAPMC
jgi:hypothetical protein